MLSKLKAAFAALCLALVSGHASAANFQGSITGNGELFAVIYDTTSHTSFIKDLNLTFSDMAANGNTAGYNLNVSISGDANFASFLSAVGSTASLTYAVMAGNDVGHVYQTTGAVQPVLNPNRNSVVNSMANPINNFMMTVQNAVNAGGGSLVLTDDSSVNYNKVNSVGDSWSNLLSTSISSALNTATSFWNVARSGPNNVLAPTVTQFGSAFGHSTWMLASSGGNYTLTYSVPVPEPGTWALMAVGLLLIVGMARRRTPM